MDDDEAGQQRGGGHSEEGSCLRLIDFLLLNSRLESNKEEEEAKPSPPFHSIGLPLQSGEGTP